MGKALNSILERNSLTTAERAWHESSTADKPKTLSTQGIMIVFEGKNHWNTRNYYRACSEHGSD